MDRSGLDEDSYRLTPHVGSDLDLISPVASLHPYPALVVAEGLAVPPVVLGQGTHPERASLKLLSHGAPCEPPGSSAADAVSDLAFLDGVHVAHKPG